MSSGFAVAVREVTEKDKNKNFGLLQETEVRHFRAVLHLLTAMAKKDHVAARVALRRLSELRDSRAGQEGSTRRSLASCWLHTTD